MKIMFTYNQSKVNMTLIGLCGKMGSGKDYIAQTLVLPFLQKKLHQTSLKFCFADQIKINVMTKDNISFGDVFEKKTLDTRKLLQREGTEQGRGLLGEDIWVRYLDGWSKLLHTRGVKNIVVSDVRFKNELEYIKRRNGVLIKVIAPARNMRRLLHEAGNDPVALQTIESHPSECDLDDVGDELYDVILKNDEKALSCQVGMLHDVLKAKCSDNSFV